MRGRPPKPTAILKLTGNPGHRPLNDSEPVPPAGVPEMPRGMRKAAQREFKLICEPLREMGLLSSVDGKALMAYCMAYADVEEAERDIRKNGLCMFEDCGEAGTKKKANPAVSIKYKALATMKAFLTEFGLTPASRSRLKVTQKPVVDPGEEFMKRGREIAGVQEIGYLAALDVPDTEM
jgi:P27 family predicted phage terminase small subunit